MQVRLSPGPQPGEVYRNQTIVRIVEPAPRPRREGLVITYARVEVRDRRGLPRELDYPVMWSEPRS